MNLHYGGASQTTASVYWILSELLHRIGGQRWYRQIEIQLSGCQTHDYRRVLVSNATDEAKAFWPIEEGEPLIPSDVIQLRELCHALELLLGHPPQDGGNWMGTGAYLFVREALMDGDLIAKSFATDTNIPSYSWSTNDAETGPEAYNSTFRTAP